MSNRRKLRWLRRRPRFTVEGSPVELPDFANADKVVAYFREHAGEWLIGGESGRCTSPLCEHLYVPDPEDPERFHLWFRHVEDCAQYVADEPGPE